MIAWETTATDAVTFADIKGLASDGGPCLTVLVDISTPFERSTRLKNAIRRAAKSLEDHGVEQKRSEFLLAPVRELAQDADTAGVWSNALIVFRSPDMFRCFLLHRRARELESVDRRFQVRPLLSALAREQRFHVLGLSRRDIRLFHCTQHGAEEANLRGVPRDMRAWLKNRQPDRTLANWSPGGPSTGGMGGVVFGTSADRDREDEYVAHFFREVDRGVSALLHGDPASLVLAGVESEIAVYRRVSTHPRLLGRAIHGSPDGLSKQELHQKAMALILQSFAEPLEKGLAEFDRYRDTSRVLSDPREAVKAAFQGRASELFISEGAEFRGAWNEEAQAVETGASGEDLLNAAASETVLHGGRAFALDAGEMPLPREVVAVLRF